MRTLPFLLLFATPAWAAAPATLPATLHDLAAPDFRTRQAAQAALENAGLDALPALRHAAAIETDPEAKSRELAAIARLEDEAALLPTRVTWDFHDATRADMIAAIEKATGKPVDVQDDPHPDRPIPKSVTLRIQNQPFWQAMASLSTAAAFNVKFPPPFGPCMTIVFGQKSDLAHLQLLSTGSFGWIRQPDLLPAVKMDAGYFRLPLTCLVDPHLKVIGHTPLHLDAATDENGNSLLPESQSNRLNIGNPRILYTSLAIPLTPTHAEVLSIRGHEHFIVATAEDTLEYPLTGQATRHLGGRDVSVSTSSVNGHYKANFNFRASPTAPPMLFAEFVLKDPTGKELDREEVGDPPQEGIEYPHDFAPGTRCFLTVASREVELDVPFNFDNIPLR
ncbi:MAG TPA: hypothetical protein VH253_13285 [Phycisphaerae bacterium]|nr:hypothetical protein [Phycisphaerae bacterium]